MNVVWWYLCRCIYIRIESNIFYCKTNGYSYIIASGVSLITFTEMKIGNWFFIFDGYLFVDGDL